MQDFLAALGLVLVLEGLVLALIPGRMAEVARLLEKIAPERLRLFGMIAAVLGLGLVWLVRGG